jgi:hypothetical protein
MAREEERKLREEHVWQWSGYATQPAGARARSADVDVLLAPRAQRVLPPLLTPCLPAKCRAPNTEPPACPAARASLAEKVRGRTDSPGDRARRPNAERPLDRRRPPVLGLGTCLVVASGAGGTGSSLLIECGER